MNARTVGLVASVVLAILSVGAETTDGVIARRGRMRAALDDAAQFETAVAEGLKDADAQIRRYALYKLYEKDPKRATKAARDFMNDPSSGMRLLAKSLCRRGGVFRNNEALSMSDTNDQATIKLLSATPKDGVFSFPQPVPEHDGVELWFGKPRRDLYVWLNGVYLGQFDRDTQEGQTFRLDATKETRIDGENRVVIRDAENKIVQEPFTAEVLKW